MGGVAAVAAAVTLTSSYLDSNELEAEWQEEGETEDEEVQPSQHCQSQRLGANPDYGLSQQLHKARPHSARGGEGNE